MAWLLREPRRPEGDWGCVPFEQFLQWAELIQSEFALALALFTLTAALVALCVPGTIIPLSFSSGALLGSWAGMAVVAAGALLGSQVLFLLIRHGLQQRVRRRWGERLAFFERRLTKRGFFYLVGLRLVGVPHFLVTAGSAVTRLRAFSFAAGSLIGFLPAIALTATAGSAL